MDGVLGNQNSQREAIRGDRIKEWHSIFSDASADTMALLL